MPTHCLGLRILGKLSLTPYLTHLDLLSLIALFLDY